MPTIGNVVEEFKLGSTKIKICDDYCRNNTPENTQKILDRIIAIGWKVARTEWALENEDEG